MILITGGRGSVAAHLTALLHERGVPIRVGSADPSALTHLPEGVAPVALNLGNPATFAPALTGVTSVFLYASADRASEFAAAAHEAGVGHIVLLSSSSVLVDDPADDPLSAAHWNAERALLGGPVPVTILRPGAFAGNAGAWTWAVKAGQPVSQPYPGAYTEPIHERDIAECAAVALTDPARRSGGPYTLTGPASITFHEQAEQLAAAIGRPVAIREVTDDQWKEQMAQYIPGPFADALLGVWRGSDGKPGQPTGSVQELTGHPARTFAQWAQDHRADFGTEG